MIWRHFRLSGRMAAAIRSVTPRLLHHLGEAQHDLRALEGEFAKIEKLDIHALGRTQMRAWPRHVLAAKEIVQQLGDQLDQRLLARHVVVQRRDIDADPLGDVARPEALDAFLDNQRPAAAAIAAADRRSAHA